MSEYGSPFSTLIRTRKWVAPAIQIVLVLGSVIFLFPMLWMLSTSMKLPSEVMVSPPQWIPKHFRWGNYAEVLRVIPFMRYLFNTVTVCVLGVLGMTASSAIVAYAFARLQWPGRELMFGVLLATMMVPFPVVMVPLYGVFQSFHWIGTLKPLWAPSFFASAVNIFLLRQFFLRIPKNLAEAMSLEGASEWTIFRRLYLPMARPALAVVALFHINYAWNDFMGPLLYLTDKDTFTLSLGLQQFQSQQGGTEWQLLMAASVMIVLPMILLFVVTQKTFLQGLTLMKHVEMS
jgi:multiple sugar transport system permease protein